MSKKYEITTQSIEWKGRKLFRIKAVKSFADVKVGDLGGYIENESNLSQDGTAWVSGDAKVYDTAMVFGDAKVFNNAEIYGNANVYDDANVFGEAEVGDHANVKECAWVSGHAKVYGDTWVYGNAWVCGDADYVCVKGLGSRYRNTTFFKCKNGDIYVTCGCFEGNLDEFTKKVKITHGDSKYAKEYLAMVEVVKIHFENENGNESGEQSD